MRRAFPGTAVSGIWPDVPELESRYSASGFKRPLPPDKNGR